MMPKYRQVLIEPIGHQPFNMISVTVLGADASAFALHVCI